MVKTEDPADPELSVVPPYLLVKFLPETFRVSKKFLNKSLYLQKYVIVEKKCFIIFFLQKLKIYHITTKNFIQL